MHYHISKYIDHTYLKAEATKFEIEKLCNEAKEYQFYSVCVNPYWVKYCFSLLQNTNVKVCTVIGFPLGATSKETKVFETKEAIQNGATEVDMVLNIGALKSGDIYLVEEEIKAIVEVAKPNVLVKVILETALLTDEEKIIACEISKRAGADFVKTSTGFSSKGATVEDITLMRKIVGNDMGVKASGSVNTLEKINDMLNAGANRIGTSSGVFVLNHKTAEDDY